jgi:Family of unknown function (DUF5683)
MQVCSILKTFLKILIIIILQLICIQGNSYAQDTLEVVTDTVKHKFSAEPFRASMMAFVFPGLGQIYNRKYWKIPVVYAGFGGLIFSASRNSVEYNRFMSAYQDFTDDIRETDSYLDLITDDPATYDPVLYPDSYSASTAETYKERMLRMVDYHRKYRDLSYIGIATWYLISILDANVDASLFNYDVSDNLDLAVFPSTYLLPGGYTGAGVNMSLRITF